MSLVFLSAAAHAVLPGAVGINIALQLAFAGDMVGVVLTFCTSDGFPFVFLGLELSIVQCEAVS